MLNLFRSFAFFLIFISNYSCASPFEIKVHEDLIADYQQSAYEVETNLYKTKSLPNITTAVSQTRLEYGYGITKASEIGVNIFLSNYNGRSYLNGGKISYMYIPTHDEEGLWHYGLKNEINFITDIGGIQTNFFEITPILSLTTTHWKFTINTSIDLALNNTKKTTLSPSFKFGYRAIDSTYIGFEYYVDNLPFSNLGAMNQQPNTGYFVMDTTHNKSQLSFGLGKGFATSTDNWIIKAVGAFTF
jgi:hypothetical protein